jgi:two-component system KDP operon response regulator KdpE
VPEDTARRVVVPRVLVVDDEPQMRRALAANLNARGYQVDLAASGEEALQRAAAGHPDAVLLDIGLPGIDGIEVVRGMRGWSSVPIIMLSVLDDEVDKVAALDAGADDYVVKPFGINELLARLRAALRRHEPTSETAVVTTAEFSVDLGAAKVWRRGEEVHLTPIEWELTKHLVRNPGRLLTQQWLFQQVWGPGPSANAGYLRVYLARLRGKLEPNPSQPRYFVTEPGLGYRFEPDDVPGDADDT